MVLRQVARAGAPLWGTVVVRLERTSVHLFIFQRALHCPAHSGLRHGSNGPRGDNHSGFCTVGIGQQQAIVDEVPTCEPRALSGGVVELDSGWPL